MDAAFCVEALKEVLAKHGKPEIINSDQGSQFTSGDWIDVLTDAKIRSAWMARAHGATTA